MEKLTGKFLSAHTLEKAIRLVNDKRRSLSRLNSLRKEKHIPISGKDALLISQLALNDDIERFTSRVNRLADELEKRVREKTGVFPPDTPRIMVSGCPMVIPNWKVHNLIETSGGAVVAEEMCTGTRYFSDCVEEGLETVEEKIKAIAQRYMKLDCACFTPNSERIENVVRLAREYHVQGIVSYIIQECHAYNIEHEKLKMRLEKEGIPLLKIETDYTQSDTGQLKTRIEAFLEQISHAFSSKSVL
jgi:benzoyl-CoA reductase/2-hydroxyglutaryl-CoA dehydratase subunit BcrC/BadD/HgdB